MQATIGGPEPLVRVSTVEALERELRRRILEGELTPGLHLREKEIASDYGVGRYTVRSAFQTLVLRGIAVYEPNRGVSVLRPTADVIEDVYKFRAAIESEAARLIIEGNEPLDGVRAALDDLLALPANALSASFAAADVAVHEALVEASGCRRMYAAFLDMADVAILAMKTAALHGYSSGILVNSAEAKQDHVEILAALESGSADQAVAIIRRHLYEMVPE